MLIRISTSVTFLLVMSALLTVALPAVAQTAPYPPNGLVAQTSGAVVTLTWNASPRATTYVVEAGSAPGLSDLGRIDTGGPATTFTAPSVPNGIYYVRVRGRNAAGDSQPTNEVTVAVGATCALPTASGLVATVTNTAVTLAWSGAGAAGYRLEVGPVSGSSSYYDLDLGAVTSATGILARGTYYMRVRARNACGLGMPSNEAIVAVDVPAAPGLLTASVITSAVTLQWSAPPGGNAVSYVIGAGSAPGAFDLGYIQAGSATSYTATGVPPGTYAVRVQAVGSSGGLGPHSNELAVTVGPPPPGTSAVTFTGLPVSSAFVSHTEAGYVIENVSGAWTVAAYGRPAPFIQFSRLASDPLTTGQIRVTAAGGTFRMTSVDLYSSVTPIPYTLSGTRGGVPLFTASGTVPNTLGNLATVPNPFPHELIDTLIITVANPATPCCSNPVGIDNIVLKP